MEAHGTGCCSNHNLSMARGLWAATSSMLKMWSAEYAPGIEILTSQVLILFWKRVSPVTFVPFNMLRWKDLFKWQIIFFFVRITFCILQTFKKYENVIIPPRTPKDGWFLQNTFHTSPNNLSFEYFNFFYYYLIKVRHHLFVDLYMFRNKKLVFKPKGNTWCWMENTNHVPIQVK